MMSYIFYLNIYLLIQIDIIINISLYIKLIIKKFEIIFIDRYIFKKL